MQTQKDKIKNTLADAYDAILAAITNEDGLDGTAGQRVMRKILKLFETPFPPVRHGKIEGCPYVGRHNFAECGLDVPLNLRKKGFKLK